MSTRKAAVTISKAAAVTISKAAAVTISKAAAKKFGELLKTAKPGEHLKLSVKSGGCNGFNYDLKLTGEEPRKFDDVVEINDNIKLHVCGSSLMYVLGTNIDWSETLLGQNFVFDNPLATSKCGCGTSFDTSQ